MRSTQRKHDNSSSSSSSNRRRSSPTRRFETPADCAVDIIAEDACLPAVPRWSVGHEARSPSVPPAAVRHHEIDVPAVRRLHQVADELQRDVDAGLQCAEERLKRVERQLDSRFQQLRPPKPQVFSVLGWCTRWIALRGVRHPGGLRAPGWKNRPAPFPGRMPLKATKPWLLSVLSLSYISFECDLCCYLGPIFVLRYFALICVLSFGWSD